MTQQNPADPRLANEEASPPAVGGAELVAGLVDVLIPGGDGWPSAATVGVQSVLSLRLLEELGEAELARLGAAILFAGGPLAEHGEDERVAIVKRLEAAEPTLFGWVRDAAYMAYYESPFVAAAINAKGHRYELRPHAKGYLLAPFDLERDTPRHGRGGYVSTQSVRPLDFSALDLDSNRTQAWGVKR